MRRMNLLLICAFLLFVNTSIQSNTYKKAKPIITIPPVEKEYEIPEFAELNESIKRQIELNNTLDSLTKPE